MWKYYNAPIVILITQNIHEKKKYQYTTKDNFFVFYEAKNIIGFWKFF